ncbi:MAG: TerC family protein, partial [Alphaproteobacteria bacterium]
KKEKTLRQAMIAIVVADVSMSLDNVLAVAGAARDNLWVLVFGLTLSIALMAVASNYIAKLLERHHWIAYIGLAIVAYVAIDMISRGFVEVAEAAV